MRILIIGLNYLPESTSIGPYTADLAEHLQRSGHHVQVVTGFPVAPHFRVWDGYRGRRFMREMINGIPVIRTYLWVPDNPGRAINRVGFDMSFAISSMLGGLLSGPVDVIVAISPPLQVGLAALALARLKKAKVLLQIKDLVPDAAIAAGMLAPASRAARIGFALERFVCRHVDRVGVICEGFRTNLTAKGVRTDKVELLPDYVDLEFMRPVERRNSFRHEHGIGDDEFVIAYSGSIALKQGLQVFVEAAARMTCEPRVRCLLIGNGPYLSDLQDSADKLGARNLTFLPLQPREQLPMQLGAADALLITQRKAVNDCVFPGKLLYYMAAGRPILAAVSEQSETGRFIRQHRVGIVTPPEEPEALVEGMSSLRADPGGAAEMGRNGREIAEQMFDRKRVLDRFEKVLSGCAA